MNKIIMGFVIAGLLTACASSKPKEEAPAAAPPVATTPPSADVSGTTPPATEATPVESASAPASLGTGAPAKRSVFYALDAYAVEEGYKSVVQEHAKYLGEHPAKKVRLEGNADERGSNEYNLALGQRRADGVKRMLVLGGVKESQIDTASYGEEKPRCMEHDETCWSQNRRTDLVY
jgi:peptidoglycan-associated lipoprotein